MAYNLNLQRHLVVYTNGNMINNKTQATAMVLLQKIIYKVFFGSSHCFIVYLSKLQGIAIALNIILSQTNLWLSKATIFTNN